MKKICNLLIVILCITFLDSCKVIKKLNANYAEFHNDLEEEWLRQDVNKRLANYEWFYDQYAVIQSTSTKVVLAQEPEKTAIKMILADMVEDYNAKSRMSHTKAMWKPLDLPYQIDLKNLIGE